MKIALVHELLTIKGGAEKVLRILSDLFPDAPIYTLLYDEKKLSDWFPKERVRTSIVQPHSQFSILNSQLNHHLYLNKFPHAVEAWDFSEFDIVLSTSSAFTHGIITNGKPVHLSYIHSPARYLWDRTHDVLERAGKGLLGPLRKKYLSQTFHKLRTWDSEVAARPERLLAASKEVQRRIELYWRRDSDVVYPPIDDMWLTAKPQKVAMEHPEYFLVVSTLASYKRIDLAIEACNQQGVHLKIVGEGPARRSLEKIAGPTIEFYGFRQNDELVDLYGNAIATIFAGEEDFGLVPLESMACGTPVIAYRGGGALETVIDGETGEFFDEATPESLGEAIKRIQKKTFSKDSCRAQAAKFSRKKFEAEILKHVDELLAVRAN